MGVDYVGVDYVGVDYVGVDYVGVDYVGVDYVGVDYVGVDYVGVDYVGVDYVEEGLDNVSAPSRHSSWVRRSSPMRPLIRNSSTAGHPHPCMTGEPTDLSPASVSTDAPGGYPVRATHILAGARAGTRV